MDKRITPLVSVVVTTYNHEKYIAQAIDSFMMQQTNFDYEIVINDDCSTDNTPKILREYEKIHPEKIRVIYQQENQYSKGYRSFLICASYAKGKYIAPCEGDDYWTDPNKLQLQADILDSNPDCSLCTHSTTIVNKSEKTIGKLHLGDDDKIIKLNPIIYKAMHLNSFMFKSQYLDNLPKYYMMSPVGDVPLKTYLGTKGKIYNIGRYMSCYRKDVQGSWTNRIYENKEKFTKLCIDMIDAFKVFDEETNHKYSDLAENRKIYYQYLIHKTNNNHKEIIKSQYSTYYSTSGRANKIKIFMNYYFPFMERITNWGIRRIVKIRQNMKREIDT